MAVRKQAGWAEIRVEMKWKWTKSQADLEKLSMAVMKFVMTGAWQSQQDGTQSKEGSMQEKTDRPDLAGRSKAPFMLLHRGQQTGSGSETDRQTTVFVSSIRQTGASTITVTITITVDPAQGMHKIQHGSIRMRLRSVRRIMMPVSSVRPQATCNAPNRQCRRPPCRLAQPATASIARIKIDDSNLPALALIDASHFTRSTKQRLCPQRHANLSRPATNLAASA